MSLQNNKVLEEQKTEMEDNSIKFGKLLANPPPGEEVVITGLAGRYPDSKDVHHFAYNLFNKVDMVSCDNRRWDPTHPEIPQRTGKVPMIEKCDAGFLGVHHRQATCMDPMGRMLLERVLEAIFDAGLHPSELEGTKTGVFVGSCFSENEKTWFFDKLYPESFAIAGCERSMLAHRVSYYLKLQAPSFICDTACSSSLYALEYAYKAIRIGQCDKAIVAGTNICLHPFVSLQFARLGVLSMDGVCKVFDNAGNGYVRSEAVSAVILQKAKDARRIYATILHAKTNCDGYKDSGITYPSGEMQVRLLKEVFEEVEKVKATELSFLEAHGTGTKVGDPEELLAIEEIFLKGRKKPLLIGSVKSNIGHTEPSSGLSSITKVLIGMETGFIPPNLHYKTPKQGIKSLEDGRLQVVTEKMPFQDDRGIIGVNSFGFGGGNCHILLQHCKKNKINSGRPKDDLVRLVCVSGRNKLAVNTLLDDVIENNLDAEHVRLLQQIFSKNFPGHLYRGFSLVTKYGEITRSLSESPVTGLPFYLGFGDLENIKIGKEFLGVPVFAATIENIHIILREKEIDINSILNHPTKCNEIEKMLAKLSIQLGITNIIKNLELEPKGLFALDSLSELICAYFDNTLTLKEVIEIAYQIALFKETDMTQAETLASKISQILPNPKKVSHLILKCNSLKDVPAESIIDYLGNSNAQQKNTHAQKKKSLVLILGNYSNNDEIMNMVGTKSIQIVNMSDGFNKLLNAFGILFESGQNPQVHKIYPKIDFPVSRGTPMISPKIKWNHDKDWFVTLYKLDQQLEIEEKTTGIMLKDPSFTFMGGHVIDGRNLMPATGYLELVWETLAHVHGLMISDMQVTFEDCKFKRACSIPKEGSKLELTVMVQRGTGNFEVIEGGVAVVTGRIYIPKDFKGEFLPIPLPTGVKDKDQPNLSSRDIYKELKLRGYNYKDEFRALQSCDTSIQVGKITWIGNWITFIDNMLQMKILQEDTRLLYVPVTIKRLSINAKEHLKICQSYNEERPVLPVYACPDSGIIRSGGIELRGLVASSIARRKYLGTPVLESYDFVPNITTKLKIQQSIRVLMQIALENAFGTKVKVVELVDEATKESSEPLSPMIFDALNDQPLIQSDITILSKHPIESVTTVNVEDKKLLTETDNMLVVGSNILQRPTILQLAFGSLKSNGYILSREPLNLDLSLAASKNITILSVHHFKQEKLVFFRKSVEYTEPIVVNATLKSKKFDWLPKLQAAVKKDANVVVYTQREPLSGVLGLVNCIRREPGGGRIKCFFIVDDNAPDFDPKSPFYVDQIKNNMAVNVFKNNSWGTYRHLLLEALEEIEAEQSYLNNLVKGDISSVTWIEGPLSHKSKIEPEDILIDVYYTSLNFRDVMTISGKINVDVITRDRRDQECVIGFEFAGRTSDGRRVAGMAVKGALSTLIASHCYCMVEIPEFWSLADAATMPVVYLTCLHALIRIARMKKGNVVLIHSGTGGIGQAAITLALHFGCKVYTTVGTQEKRTYIKKRFPQLSDADIFSSRDTSFEKQIIKATKGRGVDIVLNSLSEEKLQASIRCLAQGGQFIEIGKFDLGNDNTINLLLLEKNASFHGVMLDQLFTQGGIVTRELMELLTYGLQNGIIKPLPRTMFKINEVEPAFRHMMTGNHTGKVVIEIRKEEVDKRHIPETRKFKALPRYYCHEDYSYIICGGLGGFGLELADWLVIRGCKKIVLNSRTGLKSGYQAYRINIWKSYGCNVVISTDDITTRDGCEACIKTASDLGPVAAVFNLAVVLKDAILENQTEESFQISFAPKADATEHLDYVTRRLCPELKDFVVFSSVSCGRGNAGQSNYGMANSVMERICENRKKDGYPALAIEWGAIGEVGLVADMQESHNELEIGGTLQQRLFSCLQVLDLFLKQKRATVVSSMVVAEKRGSGGADNILDAVANILGLKDIKSVSFYATLAELGMDSMTAVEIKQTLEREFEVFLTAQDIKSMTFSRLQEIEEEKKSENDQATKKDRALNGMEMVLRLMGDATTINIPVIPLKSRPSINNVVPKVVVFPGIEGVATVLDPLANNLEAELIGLQFCNNNQADTIEGMAKTLLPYVEEHMTRNKAFVIIAYSFGAVVALEVVQMLESKGYYGDVICIDGSPSYLKGLTQVLEIESEDMFQTSLLVHLMAMHISYDVISKHTQALLKCATFEDRLNMAQGIVGNNTPHSPEHQKLCAINVYKRLKALVGYEPQYMLKSNVKLFKPKHISVELKSENYELDQICEKPVEVRVFDGNHVTILENPDLADALNSFLSETSATKDSNLFVEPQSIKTDIKTI